MHILVIEDDLETAQYILKGLKESGHSVDTAADGREGLFMGMDTRYDAMIIDRMLPAMEGLVIIKTLRAAENYTPVVILSALGEGYSGGDDYLVKPFAFSELLARLEVLTRRQQGVSTENILRLADLEINLLSREVRRAGQLIEFQPREFRLLEYLMQHSGQVVTRTMLYESVWDYHFDPQTNVIDVHISRLRRKIDKGFSTPLLHTVRGAGYCLRESE